MDPLVRAMPQMLRQGLEPKPELRDGMAVRIVIIHAQTAAQVDVVDLQPLALEMGNDAVRADAFMREHILHVRDLGPDMEMKPLENQILAGLEQGDDPVHVLLRDAEFVHLQAGRDEPVRMGVHIRIDPDGNIRFQSQPAGQLFQGLELLNGLAVERTDSGTQGIAQLLIGLADAGKDDLLRRKTMFQRIQDLVAADAVGPQAGLRNIIHEPRFGIGLDRIMHQDPILGRLGRHRIDRPAEQVHVIVPKRSLDRFEILDILELKHDSRKDTGGSGGRCPGRCPGPRRRSG